MVTPYPPSLSPALDGVSNHNSNVNGYEDFVSNPKVDNESCAGVESLESIWDCSQLKNKNQ